MSAEKNVNMLFFIKEETIICLLESLKTFLLDLSVRYNMLPFFRLVFFNTFTDNEENKINKQQYNMYKN